MSGRHQPLNGADSAEALDPMAIHDLGCQCWPHVSQQAAVKAIEAVALAEYRDGLRRRQCAACSLPAVTEGYCAGHSRLFEYTDRERSGGIAANE